MVLKEGASLQGLKIQMQPVLKIMEKLFKQVGHRNEGCTVTSGTDGTHSAGSLHYYGYALDFRIRDPAGSWRLTDFEEIEICKKARKKLGSCYHVILHGTHIHIEFDRALILIDDLHFPNFKREE